MKRSLENVFEVVMTRVLKKKWRGEYSCPQGFSTNEWNGKRSRWLTLQVH